MLVIESLFRGQDLKQIQRRDAMEAETIKNATSEKIIFSFLVMILIGLNSYGQNNMVNLPENRQNRNDVIVFASEYHNGLQTKIMSIDDTYIHYIKYKKNGTEKEKKTNKTNVAFTLTFDEKAKHEYYPVQMSVQDFISLPTYRTTKGFIVFGTDNISNLSYLENIYPDIYHTYVSGDKMAKSGSIMGVISAPVLFLPLMIPGMILNLTGAKKINEAFDNYYGTCVNSEVLAKYGIIFTPYNTSWNLKK